MRNDKEKLIAFLERNNLTQTQLSKALNIKQQVISKLISDVTQESATPSVKYMLLKIYGYDIETDKYIREPLEPINKVVAIPFYNVKAAAGVGITPPDYLEKDVIYFDERYLKRVLNINPLHASIIQAEGNSMDSGHNNSKDIQDGDFLLIDDSINYPIDKQVFVIRLADNKLVVKQVLLNWDDTYVLHSYNPAYADIIPDADTQILGKVVWNGSKENV